jgi:hypothetical protein
MLRSRQKGMTFLGVLVLILVAGTWVYAGIKLAPIYLEYMKVASTLEKVRDEYNSNPETSEFMIRKAFERHFNIEMVNVITEHDILIKRDGGMYRVTAAYEETTPFAFNVSFLVSFDKTVEIQAR